MECEQTGRRLIDKSRLRWTTSLGFEASFCGKVATSRNCQRELLLCRLLTKVGTLQYCQRVSIILVNVELFIAMKVD